VPREIDASRFENEPPERYVRELGDVGNGVSSMFGRARLKDVAPGRGSEPGQERTISVTSEKRELKPENIKIRWR